ncbi:hypothetical protein F7725_021408 [Dissostichus mawsoni]|uniref:Myosin tail domain-containing protein n=1 Tax=Dissostichus mawsoni TaxID=36200 RepID=A0A7J5ZDA4_DISMA|nr:hypothetical protein F7725_021408 [Dissostichus mawsoni]
MESLQASLDLEMNGKAEGLKLKKKQEADITELELQVDMLTKNSTELNKNSKKMQQQMKELQAQLEEEVRSHEEDKEEQAAVERRCTLLFSEATGTRSALESAERVRKVLDTECRRPRRNSATSTASGRRNLEMDLQNLQQEHEELRGELRGYTDRSKKTGCEGYSTPYPGLLRSPSSVGSEGGGEKILRDNQSVSSLIPAYLDSLQKLMVD